MTTAELAAYFATATLPGSLRLNSGELATDLRLYVRTQLARMKVAGRTAELATAHLEHVFNLLNEKK